MSGFTSSCSLQTNAAVPADVIVQNDAVMIVLNGFTLDIDFSSNNLTVESGSGVLIEAGGKIT